MYQKPRLPLSISQLLVESVKLYRLTFKHVFFLPIIAMLFSLIPWILSFEDTSHPSSFLNLSHIYWPYILIQIAISGLVIISYSAMIIQIAHVFNGEKTRFLNAILHGSIQSPFLFLFLCLYLFLVFAGLIFFIIPGIIFGVSCYLGIVLIAEGKKNPIGALIESHELIWPHWWRGFCLLGIPMIIMFLLSCLLRFGFHNYIVAYPHLAFALLFFQGFLVVLLGALFASWFYGLNILFFNDLRLRTSAEVNPVTDNEPDSDEIVLDFLDKNT